MTEQPYRTAPHNLEAEQALLGAILINNDACDRVSDFLEAQHFFDRLHGQIYETAAKLITSGKRADPLTLKPYFENAEQIDDTTTVPQYLGSLARNATTIINARDYGRTIHDLAVRRGLIRVGEDIVNAAYDSPVDFPPREQIEEAETRLFSLAENGRDTNREVSATKIQTLAVAVIEAAHKNKGEPTGLSTGSKDIDVKIGRLQPGRLIVVAGRPSMGKTSLATNIVRAQIAAPVHFFSLEMSSEEIGLRLLSEEVGIPGDELRSGELDEGQWRRVLAAKEKLGRQPLKVDPTGGSTIGQIAIRARRAKRKHGTALIVVDYLQLAHGTKRSENRTQEVSEITMGLKALAKELNVPIIALSQLNRDLERREDKRPTLADLRESGSIEQDADQVIFLFREEYYLERMKPDGDPQSLVQWAQKMDRAKGKAEAIIAKNRHGPTGLVALHFEASCTRFSDLAVSGQAPNAAEGPAAFQMTR